MTQQEQLTSIITDVLTRLGTSAEFSIREVEREGEKELLINLTMTDPQLFIGQHGNHLAALQHLARLLARKQMENPIHFSLDINEYKAQKEVSLVALANETVEKVRSSKKYVILPPMSSFERHIIHSHLANEDDITTESLGEEPSRRVIVRLTEDAMVDTTLPEDDGLSA